MKNKKIPDWGTDGRGVFMVKELSPQELRDFGFPELAYLKEQEALLHSPFDQGKKTTTKKEEVSSQEKSPDLKNWASLLAGQSPSLSSSKVQEIAAAVTDFKQLLGPLVSPLLRDSGGGIDLSKVPLGDDPDPEKKFAAFVDYLKAQVEIDNISFNKYLLDSYHKLLDQKEFEPLLRLLFLERCGASPVDPTPKEENDFAVASGDKAYSNSSGKAHIARLPLAPASLLFGFNHSPLPFQGERGGGEGPALSPIPLNVPLPDLIKKFTAGLISVSGKNFVSHFIDKKPGRDRIIAVLKDKESYSLDIRADLVKAIAVVGESQAIGGLNEYLLTEILSTFNHYNIDWGGSLKATFHGNWRRGFITPILLKISEERLEKATRQALEILNTADWSEKVVQENRSRYAEYPEKVRTFREITTDQIRKMAQLQEKKSAQADPVSQMQAKLAHYWLLLADHANWQEGNFLNTEENRINLLRRAEQFLKESASIEGDKDFARLNERLRDFFQEDLIVRGGNWALTLVDTLDGHNQEDLFEPIPAQIKAPYTELKRYVDEIHYAAGENEAIYFDPVAPAFRPGSPPPKGGGYEVGINAAKARLIQGLQEAQRGMWHSYNQRSEISQAGSFIRERILISGDKDDIRQANRAISRIIEKLKSATTQTEVQNELEQVYAMMARDGVLHRGMTAAEFDGIEHFTQMLQTCAELAATALITRGIGTAAVATRAVRLMTGTQNLSGGFQALRAMESTKRAATIKQIWSKTRELKALDAMVHAQALEQKSRFGRWVANTGEQMRFGMAMGAALPAEDNLLGWASDRVRNGKGGLFSTFKDSLATSFAMGIFSPLAIGIASGSARSIFRGMLNRYKPMWGLIRFGGDSAIELGEETIDAMFRKILDGKGPALDKEEWREIAAITTAGGGLKMGSLAQAFKSGKTPHWSPKKTPLPLGEGPRRGGEGVGPLENAPPSPIQTTPPAITENEEVPAPETPEEILQTIGQTLIKARTLFKEYGLNETEISLRETTRIQEYLRTFAPTMGMARATVVGFWLTLGAHLTPEHRQGELGLKLKELILKTQAPSLSSDGSMTSMKEKSRDQRAFGFGELDPQILKFDSGKDMEFIYFEAAAKQDPFFAKFQNRLQKFQYQMAHLDKLSPEKIENFMIKALEFARRFTPEHSKFQSLFGESSSFGFTLSEKQFAALMDGIKNANLTPGELNEVYTEFLNRFNLNENQIGALLAEMDSEEHYKIFNWITERSLGKNPNLGAGQVVMLCKSLIKILPKNVNGFTFGAKVLAPHPNLLKEDWDALRQAILKNQGLLDNPTLLAYLALNPNLTQSEFTRLSDELAQIIKNEKEYTKLLVSSILVQSPHSGYEQLKKLIDRLLDDLWDPDKPKLLALAANSPHFTAKLLPATLRGLLGAATHYIGTPFSGNWSPIGENPRFGRNEFVLMMQAIQNAPKPPGNETKARALAALARNPSLHKNLYDELMEEITRLHLFTVFSVLSHPDSHSREKRDQLYERFEAIEEEVERLKQKSADQTARVEEQELQGDELRELLDPQPIHLVPGEDPQMTFLKAAAQGTPLQSMDLGTLTEFIAAYDPELSCSLFLMLGEAKDLVAAARTTKDPKVFQQALTEYLKSTKHFNVFSNDPGKYLGSFAENFLGDENELWAFAQKLIEFFHRPHGADGFFGADRMAIEALSRLSRRFPQNRDLINLIFDQLILVRPLTAQTSDIVAEMAERFLSIFADDPKRRVQCLNYFRGLLTAGEQSLRIKALGVFIQERKQISAEEIELVLQELFKANGSTLWNHNFEVFRILRGFLEDNEWIKLMDRIVQRLQSPVTHQGHEEFFEWYKKAFIWGKLISVLEGKLREETVKKFFEILDGKIMNPSIGFDASLDFLRNLADKLEGEEKIQVMRRALDRIRKEVKNPGDRDLYALGLYLKDILLPLCGSDPAAFETVEEISKALQSNSDEYVASVGKDLFREMIRSSARLRETYRLPLEGLLQRYQEMKASGPDLGVKAPLEPQGKPKLSTHLQILGAKLEKNNPQINSRPRVTIDSDFDPTLITAHKLTNYVVQALAINRFVLISGEPASGKSEVGRYIAKLLNWDHHIFNAHRYLSQEEVMQKIGILANGKTRFTITDGPLADALIHGKLFILNEIHRAKAGNLSFLFNLLADIETEFDYYDATLGKTVRRKIHPNFRMIATRNLDGSMMNAALKNRAIEIYADRYSDLELAALLRSKYPNLSSNPTSPSPPPLSPGGGEGNLADILVRFYEDMRHRMEAKAIGDHSEGYAWNLRHLMRIADGFAALLPSPLRERGGGEGDDFSLNPQTILQTLWDKVGVSLIPQDRDNFFDAVRNFEYNGIKVTEADVQQFQEKQKNLKINEILGEDSRAKAMMAEMKVKDLPTSARYLDAMIKALKAGYHPWLKGPAGTGKSKLARLAGALLGKVYKDTLTPQTDESQLKGDFKPRLILIDGKEELGFQNVPSHLINALRDRTREGLITCILDEAAHARPDVVEELNTLLDRDGGIWVISEDGKKQEFIERPKNFRLILVSNTYGYEGVNLQSEAFRSRTHEVFMGFEYDAAEIVELLSDENTLQSSKDAFYAPLGRTLHAARQLLIDQGEPETTVTLREVNRIKNYLNIFLNTQALRQPKQIANTILRALWLTLGAHLSKGKREGDLGSKLKDLLASIEIPGIESGDLNLALSEIVQPKRVEFNPEENPESLLLMLAAARNPLFRNFSRWQIFTYRESQVHRWTEAELWNLIEEMKDEEGGFTADFDRLHDVVGNPSLPYGHVKVLLHLVKDLEKSKSHQRDILENLAANPALSPAQLTDLIQWVQDESTGFDKYAQEYILGGIGRNVNLFGKPLEELVLMAKASPTLAPDSPMVSSLFLGVMSNPNLSPDQLEDLLQTLVDMEGTGLKGNIPLFRDRSDISRYPNQGAVTLAHAADNPQLSGEKLEKLLKWALSARINDNPRMQILEKLCANPNLNTGQLDTLIIWAISWMDIRKERKLEIENQIRLLALLRRHPNGLPSQRQIIDDCFDYCIEQGKIIRYGDEIKIREKILFGLSQDPQIDPKEYKKIMEELAMTSPNHFQDAMKHRHPSALLYQEEVYQHYLSVIQAKEELANGTGDGAAHIIPIQNNPYSLPQNLSMLSGVLGQNGEEINSEPRLTINPDFDPTLVTAYTLTNHLVQSLAINRFVLISGEPASGKSEAGRYLAKLLNWGCHIFNAHRYLSQEEVMQKIGIVANGKTRFTITDGPLADALINGKLFILNEIHRAKAGNLSFLFSLLADIDTEFDYYDASTGKTVRKKIHPNFRMIATRNLDGSNMNEALKNRAIEISADRYSDLELAALLRSKYPGLSAPSPLPLSPVGGEGNLADTLVRFYEDMRQRMASKAIGQHGEGYAWNMRHLMRITEGFNALRPSPLRERGGGEGDGPTLNPQKILQVLWDRVGVSLTLQDRDNFFDAVRNFEYAGVMVSEADVQNFKEGLKKLNFNDVLGDDPRLEELKMEMGVKDLPTSARYLDAILKSLKSGYHPWLKGPAGTGKSKVARLAGALLGKVYMDTLTPQTDESQLKGEFKPRLIKVNGKEELGFQHVPSHLVNALRDQSKQGLITCILDEAAHARPDVVEELNTLLDRDGGIWVISEDGTKQEFIERPENFRLILVSNTYGYEGVQLQSEAFRSRTHEIFMGFEYTPEEIAELLSALSLPLGKILHKARQLFIDQGDPETSVTLREVNRVKNYLDIFLPSRQAGLSSEAMDQPDELARTILRALWLTLGAHLSKEKRDGELGAKLKDLLSEIDIPGTDRANLKMTLSEIVQPRPADFNAAESSESILLMMAAAQDSLFQNFSHEDLFTYWETQLHRWSEAELRDLMDDFKREDGEYYWDYDPLREFVNNFRLPPDHVEALLHWVKHLEGSSPNKGDILDDFCVNPVLSPAHLADLLLWIKDPKNVFSKTPSDQILGTIGRHPNFFGKALEDFISMAKADAGVFLMGDILANPNLSPDQFDDLVETIIKRENINLDEKVIALGNMGKNKKVLARQIDGFFQWLEGLDLDGFTDKEFPLPTDTSEEKKSEAYRVTYALIDMAANPQLAGKNLDKLLNWGLGSHVEKNARFELLEHLSVNPNLNTTQLILFINSIKEGKIQDLEIEDQIHFLATLRRHPKALQPQKQFIDEFFAEAITQEGSVSRYGNIIKIREEVLYGLSRDPQIDPKEYKKIVNELANTAPSRFHDAMKQRHPSALLYQEEVYGRYLNLLKTKEELASGTGDAAVRIMPMDGDNFGLPQNLAVLANLLGENGEEINSEPTLTVDPDFDPTLVTAYKLTDQTIQALAINRFVLISGDPASGKTEVGRYLSKLLNWGCHLFNAHRYLSQEEVVQKIGIVANGKTRFTITDGPLANALIHGKLFILNEIHRAKAGNLSFLFSLLADIDTEFDYYDASTGKTIRREIHPNFRMIATRNLDGSTMNEALKNRAIEISAEPYGDLELAALLRSKYPNLSYHPTSPSPLPLSPGGGEGNLADTLVQFYGEMKHRMAAKTIGTHAEGYAWNLRHLMRMAEGFDQVSVVSPFRGDLGPQAQSGPKGPHYGEIGLNPQTILQTLWDRVGVSLTLEDRLQFFDAVMNFEYRGIKITDPDIQAFRHKIQNLTFKDVWEEFDIDLHKAVQLGRIMKVKDIPTSARYFRALLQSLKAGYHPWLKGPAGTGKSKLARLAAALLGRVYMDTLTPQTDGGQLKGEFKPRLIKIDGKDELGFQHVPSHLVNALRDHSGQGLATCILDEAAHARADVVEELNTLLDRDGGIWVISEDGTKQEFLERPKNFRLILVSNNYGYEGVNLQSEAFRSRTHEIFMGFEFSAEELDELMGIKPTSPLTPGPSPLGGERGMNVPLAPFGGEGLGVRGDIPAAPKMARSFGTSQTYTQRIQRRSNPPPSAARINTIDMRGTPVRDKLWEVRDQIPEAEIEKLEKKFEEVKNRLLGAAAAMGRTGEISIEFDPTVATCSMKMEAPRIFQIGIKFLSELSIEDLINNALHEGGHADISRIGSGFFFKNSILHALFNTVEDIRVDHRAMDRAPGRADSYRRFLVKYYGEAHKNIPDEKIPKVFPHEAFLEAILTKEYGGVTPWDKDPLVGPALREVWSAIQKVKESRPKEANPEETVVQRYAAQVEEILKREILPTYERLYQEALKQAKEALKNMGAADPSAFEGDLSGRPPLIDPNDLDEEAKKLLEERGKRIADAHAPKGDLGDKQKKARTHFGDEGEEQTDKPAKPEKTVKPGSLEEALNKRHEDYLRQQRALKSKPFSKLLSDLKSLPQKVFEVLDRLLKPNTDFEYEGFYPTGPRPDIQRAVKAIHGLLANLNVFKRKTEPTAKDYRFSLLLDASGSMNDNGIKLRGGMGMAALFVDVFERLNLPYGLDAFHNGYIPLKDFKDKLKTMEERNDFFTHINLDYWGGGGTNLRGGIRGALKRISEARKGDPRDREFLFVLTDGEETHQEGETIRQLCEEAYRKGIIVVGIGIGDGMETVKAEFPIHLVEKNPENLPHLLAEFIKEYVRSEQE